MTHSGRFEQSCIGIESRDRSFSTAPQTPFCVDIVVFGGMIGDYAQVEKNNYRGDCLSRT